MRLVNISGSHVRTAEFGGLDVPPGGTCELPDGYCRPGRHLNGSRAPSLVEILATGLVPVDDAPPVVLVADPVAEKAAALAQTGLPPAVAALVAVDGVEAPRERKKPGPKPKGSVF